MTPEVVPSSWAMMSPLPAVLVARLPASLMPLTRSASMAAGEG